METLEKSRMCRLCGKQSGISIDIFDKNESHVRKINAILPILVHEMDLLPKQMCHRCSYKLEEFYNFYVECAKTDTELKSQLSWMRKENLEEKIITPMVKMNRFKVKTEMPDNNDLIDPNSVLGHISESSLLLPASILHNNFDSNVNPLLSCSRCRCLCNRSFKTDKKLPKKTKKTSKTESGNEAHSSNNLSRVEESEKLESGNKDSSFNEDDCKVSNFKEADEILVINLDSSSDNECVRSESGRSSNFQTELLNRALRPRKGSVDYMGPKKKGLATNLKAKLKSNLDMLDPSLINIRMSQSNSVQGTPIIKLEKVDDTVRILRTSKNLEEFNKRIKEFQRKKILPKSGNHNKKISHQEEILSRKSMSGVQMLRRKSLQKEGNRKSFHGEENSNRKSIQRDENPNRKSLSRDDSTSRKNSQKEEHLNRKSVQREENKKSLQIGESQGKKKLHVEESNNKQCSNSSVTIDDNESVVRIDPLNIKREIVNKILDSSESFEQQLLQEKPVDADLSKKLQAPKPVDRLPMCAVVKLEKDYTCNVDYPRIKIKRHLPIPNCSKSEDSNLKVPVETKSVFELEMDKKSLTQSDGSVSTKNLRSNEKKQKLSNSKNKSGKISKKKSKQLSDNTKRTVLEKSSPIVPQTDLKRYCEECDTSFRNNELFRLHPCYQK